MGEVYRSKDTRLDWIVAIKVVEVAAAVHFQHGAGAQSRRSGETDRL